MAVRRRLTRRQQAFLGHKARRDAAAKVRKVYFVLKRPHDQQRVFIDSSAKRKIVRAGRRGGKTTGAALLAIEHFLRGRRVLYAAPTSDQLLRFWAEIVHSLGPAIDSGDFIKNESLHVIEKPGTENRIRAKTAWNADTLRGDYADLLILDEWQLMNEDGWRVVGAPMLLDNNGDAVFIYTPPALHTRSTSKASDPLHAAKLWKRHADKDNPRWACFHFTSHDNPHISREALEDITEDISDLAYRQEILAEDVEEVPGALWHRAKIEELRWNNGRELPDLIKVGVGVDPPGGATECGIVTAGIGLCDCKGEENKEVHGFVLADNSVRASPERWADAVCGAYDQHDADAVYGESNYGGDMVASTIKAVNPEVSYRDVRATRGKAVRAQPVAAQYEKGRVHHVGPFPELEEELCGWVPGMSAQSPNRLDALVWVLTELLVGKAKRKGGFI